MERFTLGKLILDFGTKIPLLGSFRHFIVQSQGKAYQQSRRNIRRNWKKRKWCNRGIWYRWAHLCSICGIPQLVLLVDISILWGQWKLNTTLWILFSKALLIIREAVKHNPWHEYRKIQKAGMKHLPSFMCGAVLIERKCRCSYCKSKKSRFKTKPSRSHTPCRQRDEIGGIRCKPQP